MDIKHNSKKHYHQFFADMQEVRTQVGYTKRGNLVAYDYGY